jgi:stage II sporulation protein M
MILERSLSFVLVGLIPHGIIEIPTLLLCSAMGMSLGYSLINRLRGRGSLRLELIKAMRLFITRILPLIVLAAVIEVTVSPFLMTLFGYY